MVLVVTKGPVVVSGAAGYIGSWLVRTLLREGYAVRATVRDPRNLKKIKPLLDLPESRNRLTIWKADLTEEGSFDKVIDGCTGVFHVATPMDFESQDPENEVIKPTVDGVLSILRSCKKAASVRRVIFTSSAGTVNVQEHQKPVYNESSWSDMEFCRRVKMTGWMYFVSKILAEQAAWDFARENDMDLITVIPPLVVGPFITCTMPPSMITALALITGNKRHYSILKQIQLVHLDDLCNAHVFLLEHPEAKGRYICSSHVATIHELAKMIRERHPDYYIPTKFEGINENIGKVHFSSEKLLALGFKFQYTMEEMFDGAIESCREKMLIPLKTSGTPDGAKKKAMAANGRIQGTEEQVTAVNGREKGIEGTLVLTNGYKKGTEGKVTVVANGRIKGMEGQVMVGNGRMKGAEEQAKVTCDKLNEFEEKVMLTSERLNGFEEPVPVATH